MSDKPETISQALADQSDLEPTLAALVEELRRLQKEVSELRAQVRSAILAQQQGAVPRGLQN